MSDVHRIAVGSRVVLARFAGRSAAPAETDDRENYWRLIGSRGTVIETRPAFGIQADRVLIQFDAPVSALGLHCHNGLQNPNWTNALWIHRDDLSLST